MSAWVHFWGAWLIISGATFAGITLIVAFKGFADLRSMFHDLGAEKGDATRGRRGNSR